MPRKRELKIVQMEVSIFYDRLAWLVWKGMYQEANVLREFALWFDPPIQVDEKRVENRVQKYIDHDRKMEEPVNWL